MVGVLEGLAVTNGYDALLRRTNVANKGVSIGSIMGFVVAWIRDVRQLK